MPIVDVQFATNAISLPEVEQIRAWASAPFEGRLSVRGELTVRIVDTEESRHLNATYRHIDKATNVLSFPADWEQSDGIPYYGDIAICAQIVHSEAASQHKAPKAHWAHMVVHGVLHLLGYDHMQEDDACEMEACEIELLTQFGFCNPYQSLV